MATPNKEFKTPIKNRKIRPVQSPQTPQSPSVDGSIKRRVSDILVNLHKFIQTWELDNQASFNTANTLSSLYGQWNLIDDGENDSDEILTEDCKKRYKTKLIITREDLIKQLKHHQKKLSELITKINGLVENLKAIYYLGLSTKNNHMLQSDSEKEKVEEPVIFTTWTAERFYEVSLLLVSMYAKEYYLKQKLYSFFLNFRVDDAEGDTSVLNKYVSIWLHQPYIDANAKMYLDSMLLEAELK